MSEDRRGSDAQDLPPDAQDLPPDAQTRRTFRPTRRTFRPTRRTFRTKRRHWVGPTMVDFCFDSGPTFGPTAVRLQPPS
jgi:hypothetical protein